MKNEVAQTIFEQLGGNKFKAMTGANGFAGGSNTLGFRVPNAKKIKTVVITLTADDLYTVEFKGQHGWTKARIANGTCAQIYTVAKVEGIYNDQLQTVFTQHTGLYTRL